MWYYFMLHLAINKTMYDKFNYKKFRQWCLNHKIYSSDNTINQAIINLLDVYKTLLKQENNEYILDVQIFINRLIKDMNFLWCLSQ